jgi:hypothetical protein
MDPLVSTTSMAARLACATGWTVTGYVFPWTLALSEEESIDEDA